MTHLDHLLAEAIELFNRTDDMAELEQVKARLLQLGSLYDFQRP